LLADTGGVIRTPPGGGLLVAHDKERILTDRQTVAFERLVSRLDRGGGAGGTTVAVNISSMIPPSGAETTRAIRHVGKELRRQKGWR
jgi:hypothetical protein